MTTTATIPLPGDVAKLIGAATERVENRSLLLDKFVFHKNWPVAEAKSRHGRASVKWDEASNWSFMRIADGAPQILRRQALDKQHKARGKNVEPDNRDRYLAEAAIANTLAAVNWNSTKLENLRSRHTRRFIALFRRAYRDRASVTIGRLESRLAINLADSLIQNAGICLDRLFGLPYIPGSAVKGVCRHAALEELKAAEGSVRETLFATFRAVFGTAENDFVNGDLRAFRPLANSYPKDQKGAVSFLPAYPVNNAKIVVDLTNVHYPDYYRTGRTEDLAREKPRPNSFPAVEAGAQFAFCLVVQNSNTDGSLLGAARGWLESALTIRGLGAKTAAGYGWFSLKPEVLEEMERAEHEERDEAIITSKAEGRPPISPEEPPESQLPPEAAAEKKLLALPDEAFATFAKELASKSEIEQRTFFRLLITNKEKRTRWKSWKKKKPEIVKAIESVRLQLKLDPLP